MNLYALHSPVSLPSLKDECRQFCSSMTDSQLSTLRNNPLVPYWKPHWTCEDGDAWKTEQCFVCPLILGIYEHSSNKGIYIGGILGEKNYMENRQMEGEDMDIFIELILRGMHGNRVEKLFLEIRLISGKLSPFCLPVWFSHLLPVLMSWDSYINHTVPGSLIRPYSPLYQSNDPVFLTEESERSLVWSKDQECFLLFLNPVLQVSRNWTHCCVFFPWNWNIELDASTASFFFFLNWK